MTTRHRVCDLPAALARLGDNVVLARDIFTLIREDFPVYQARLEAAVERQDVAGVRAAVHGLKGLLCMFGGDAALQSVQRLEQMCRGGDLTEARALTAVLDREITRFLKTLSGRMSRL